MRDYSKRNGVADERRVEKIIENQFRENTISHVCKLARNSVKAFHLQIQYRVHIESRIETRAIHVKIEKHSRCLLRAPRSPVCSGQRKTNNNRATEQDADCCWERNVLMNGWMLCTHHAAERSRHTQNGKKVPETATASIIPSMQTDKIPTNNRMAVLTFFFLFNGIIYMVTASRLHSKFACHYMCSRTPAIRMAKKETNEMWCTSAKLITVICMWIFCVHKREYVVCDLWFVCGRDSWLVQFINKYWRKKEITFTLHAWRATVAPLVFSKTMNFECIRVVESKCSTVGCLFTGERWNRKSRESFFLSFCSYFIFMVNARCRASCVQWFYQLVEIVNMFSARNGDRHWRWRCVESFINRVLYSEKLRIVRHEIRWWTVDTWMSNVSMIWANRSNRRLRSVIWLNGVMMKFE